jgi:hypothetical protein
VRLVLDRPPAEAKGWDESEDVELVTLTGEVSLFGLISSPSEEFPNLTPQAGRYGLRVQARGRDLNPTAGPTVPFEFYQVTVWPRGPSESYLLFVWPIALGRSAV